MGIESFPADRGGFEALLGWLMSHGEINRVGVEGTGSWGGPEEVRARRKTGLVTEVAKLRPRKGSDPVLYTTQHTMRGLTHRVQSLNAEIRGLDSMLTELVTNTAPTLVELYGVGTDTAASFLVTAGDNPQRLRSERSWAHLCGASPPRRPKSSSYSDPWRPPKKGRVLLLDLFGRRVAHGGREETEKQADLDTLFVGVAQHCIGADAVVVAPADPLVAQVPICFEVGDDSLG